MRRSAHSASANVNLHDKSQHLEFFGTAIELLFYCCNTVYGLYNVSHSVSIAGVVRYRWSLAGWGDANVTLADWSAAVGKLRNWRERAHNTYLPHVRLTRAQSVVMGTTESSFIHYLPSVMSFAPPVDLRTGTEQLIPIRRLFLVINKINMYLLIWWFAELYMCILNIFYINLIQFYNTNILYILYIDIYLYVINMTSCIKEIKWHY